MDRKAFYIEINYCLDQLKNDWTDLLHTKSVRFAEDRYLVDQELKYLEEKFRNDILRVYVLRHQYYVKKGLIKPG